MAGRQMSRKDHAQAVVRALLDSVHEGDIADEIAVGRIVGRIIRRSPYYSERQRADLQRDWLKVLKAETSARAIGRRRDERAAAH